MMPGSLLSRWNRLKKIGLPFLYLMPNPYSGAVYFIEPGGCAQCNITRKKPSLYKKTRSVFELLKIKCEKRIWKIFSRFGDAKTFINFILRHLIRHKPLNTILVTPPPPPNLKNPLVPGETLPNEERISDLEARSDYTLCETFVEIAPILAYRFPKARLQESVTATYSGTESV
jgi:hypothetical protein